MDTLKDHYNNLIVDNTTDFYDLYNELLIYDMDLHNLYDWSSLISYTVSILQHIYVHQNIVLLKHALYNLIYGTR